MTIYVALLKALKSVTWELLKSVWLTEPYAEFNAIPITRRFAALFALSLTKAEGRGGWGAGGSIILPSLPSLPCPLVSPAPCLLQLSYYFETNWKTKRINEEEYTNRYREQIRANLKAIKAWLERLDSREHQTLLCWEHSGRDETLKRSPKTFCHRNLAIKLVEKFRPDCYGGQDVINYPMPVCRECLTKVIPALITEGFDDAHYCPKCRTWTKQVLYPNQPERQVKEKRLTPVR